MDFNRFENQMRNKTPEGHALRSERDMPFDTLVQRFGEQAKRDIEIGNAWTELSNDIAPKIDRILDETDGRDAALEIGNRHRRYMEEKGLEGDADGIAAYITAVAEEMRKRKKQETN